ncbi:TetR family transcriptional regulator [Novosphingobium sp. KCTC 2891]|uniref:TetR/AcrR family transcriptional regulator n=1 Tax=Novosphingobium sp. KCTC 2891 TaxID=2989730 RepID=UPI002221650F|nr:TetR/AcrR family transcriptional regulator [Novosphingobium sp. KCTC 2891]MCW1383548.1 TetR family transcriptional regulator [Novosphingobium sp. KCTC 2891]
MTSLVSAPQRTLTERQLERRRRILAAAQSLVAREGYDAVTMRAIAGASGTAEKTLYNIFGTKDRLVALAANARSEMVFETASDTVVVPGWERLRAFCREATTATLDEPLLSRAMALLLLDHAELVGLQQLYAERVGADVAAMIAGGLLGDKVPPGDVVRAIRLGVVSSVVFWAKGEVADAEFEAWLVRQCLQALLPHATEAGMRHFVAEFSQFPLRPQTAQAVLTEFPSNL